MIDPHEDPIEEILARSRERDERFGRWLKHLRSGDPALAEASGSHPSDTKRVQSAVYLLPAAIKCGPRWAGRCSPTDRSRR